MILKPKAQLANPFFESTKLMAATVAFIPLYGALIIFLLVFITPVAEAGVATVTATQSELDQSWKSYWNKSNSAIPAATFPYQACFEKAAKENNIPVTLALAISRGESNFNPNAVSKADAIGMMQILWPITARHLGITDKKLLYKPCINIDAGVRYLKEMLDRYNNNVHLTLAAYNYGPGRIKPDDKRVPEGAAWYSGYILNHLRYVLGSAAPQARRQAPANYNDEQRLTLITFNKPDKAGAFVDHLRAKAPTVRLDWFDRRLGRWSVDLLYQDEQEKILSSQALKEAGFLVPEQ